MIASIGTLTPDDGLPGGGYQPQFSTHRPSVRIEGLEEGAKHLGYGHWLKVGNR